MWYLRAVALSVMLAIASLAPAKAAVTIVPNQRVVALAPALYCFEFDSVDVMSCLWVAGLPSFNNLKGKGYTEPLDLYNQGMGSRAWVIVYGDRPLMTGAFDRIKCAPPGWYAGVTTICPL